MMMWSASIYLSVQIVANSSLDCVWAFFRRDLREK